jgi:tRNA1Val (adenine37-N6)-methyltransferase
MGNPYFRFKQFTIFHDRSAMKVTTDACLFGAWIAETLSTRPTTNNNKQFLDIGCGTGLLSLMVAQKIPAVIDAIEIEPAAAGQARENIAASLWKDQVKVVEADVLLWQASRKYDCIFSNPPFYENDLRTGKTENDMAHHSAKLKLQPLLSYINQHLADDGTFFLLLPAKRGREIILLLQEERLLVQQKVLVQQTLEHPPFRVMIQGCRIKTGQCRKYNISVKNGSGEYTAAFVALLKDYYLYL